jgi:AcrR family transcriptional regulator
MVERIVDAAARVLSDAGYERTSTNRIALAAGVSPGSVYQYFAGKDEIVAAIITRLADALGEGIAPVLRGAEIEGDLRPSIRAVLERVLGVVEPHAGLLRAVLDSVPAAEQAQALRSVRARLGDFVYRVLSAHRAALRSDDLDRTVWTIVELAEHLLTRYVLDRPPIAPADFADDMATIVYEFAFGA